MIFCLCGSEIKYKLHEYIVKQFQLLNQVQLFPLVFALTKWEKFLNLQILSPISTYCRIQKGNNVTRTKCWQIHVCSHSSLAPPLHVHKVSWPCGKLCSVRDRNTFFPMHDSQGRENIYLFKANFCWQTAKQPVMCNLCMQQSDKQFSVLIFVNWIFFASQNENCPQFCGFRCFAHKSNTQHQQKRAK